MALGTTSPSLVRRRVVTRLGAVAVWTGGSGPDVVLWHGMFVSSSSWRDVVAELRTTRTVWVIDGPGFGASDPLRCRTSIAECAEVAVEILDGLGLHEPVDWVGNAWGGHVGMQLAATTDRVARLVAVSAPVRPSARRMALRFMNLVMRVLGPTEAVLAVLLDLQLTAASRELPERRAIVESAVGSAQRRSLSLASASFVLDRKDATAQLGAITAPVLFVASDDRAEWTPDDAAAAASMTVRGDWTVIPGARTLIPVEQPHALVEVLHEFWAATSAEPIHPTRRRVRSIRK